MSSDDAQIRDGRLRTFFTLAERDLAKSRNLLLGVSQSRMAADDRPASLDEPRYCSCDLLKDWVNGAEAGIGHCIDAHDASLKLGHFRER